MKNILILSNNCISNSESNGRTHGNYTLSYDESGHIHNFHIRGVDDKKSVTYLSISNKKALLSKLTFGIIKPCLSINNGNDTICAENIKKSKKSNYVFFHLIRNFAYSNRKIIRELINYIKANNINIIEIWGSNIPFLYKYGYKLSSKLDIPLVIFTCEDYPLKKYNYIGHKSLMFRIFQRKLRNNARKAYNQSSLNIYATEDLKEAYKLEFKTKNDNVILFPSNIKKMNSKKNNRVINIFYGGNLYSDRCDSLIDVANHIGEANALISVYGSGSEEDVKKITECKNINYHGLVKYDELLGEMEKSDILLHVEGFSKSYRNDCKFAFSSKLSDYYLSGKPVFIYGPYEISGIKFAYNLNKDWVALNSDDLFKFNHIIKEKNFRFVSYDKIIELFDAKIAAKKFEKLIESI